MRINTFEKAILFVGSEIFAKPINYCYPTCLLLYLGNDFVGSGERKRKKIID